ncbi:hypothetical protein ASD65_17130 [Microbacterium sp. Root61]|uniref:rhamnan synthesis F family protein n=1 Tax=Microbacterium sp. Root61 TaxID=1736570 RepID=UPI0006F3FE22|nr:rhamnan synthesis F family protein [Microbacterium sp. Root61]KRA22227.1 hypothetical protein ASD65_17130 [Microbacterium sp. Root61]
MTEAEPARPIAAPSVFPEEGKRLVIYVVYDQRGDVDDFIPFALEGLRAHASKILVMVNGSLSAAGRAKLAPVSDEIIVRDNIGFDIWAHKEALDHVGSGIAEFDEVVMTNDTWFGPVRPFGPVLDRMGDRSVHFWGMTDHAREDPNPFTQKGVLPYHLQSFWIAVRRAMFLSPEWARYWRELPAMPSYFDAVLKHEAVFTERFGDAGYVHDVAYRSADYPTDHPALFNPDLLLADGCPVLKRRPFFHYPPFLDRHAVIGRQILAEVGDYGYPLALIWQNLARNVKPKVLNTDAGMLEVLPDVDVSYDPTRPMRVAAVVHVRGSDELGDVFDRLAALPVAFDLIVTTSAPDRLESLQATIDALQGQAVRRDVRLVPSRRGRDMSAFFVGSRDVLEDDAYDLVVKVHTRVPKKRGVNTARYFRRYEVENLLSSPGYFANVLGLFQRESGLGVVFPPMLHLGYATPGRAWLLYRERAVELCAELGIRVPLDGVSPLAPLGGMWIARPSAMRLLRDANWGFSDYSASPRAKGSDLGRLQERLIPLAAGELGFHSRTIMNAEHAGISHGSLEYKIDQLSATTPGYPVDQIQFLHRAGWAGHGGIIALTRMYINLNHPRLAEAVRPVTRPLGGIARRGIFAMRAIKSRLRGGSTADGTGA